MKFVILDTDYPEYLQWLYSSNPTLKELPYASQLEFRRAQLFWIGEFYAANLRKLGHEVHILYPGNRFMQRAWAKENGLKLPELEWRFIWRKGFIPWFCRCGASRCFYDVLRAQIIDLEPDILLNFNVMTIAPAFLKRNKKGIKLVIGQHAAMPLDESKDWRAYDLVLSSFPPTVEWFQKKGINAEFFKLGFEKSILENIGIQPRNEEVVFIGDVRGPEGVHIVRREWLEYLARHLSSLSVWSKTPPDSTWRCELSKCYRGNAWGIDMYRILGGARIVVNHHGNVQSYANNMRLYEATGMGALLITDWKPNLEELFDVGREIIAYRSMEECVDLVQYYLSHEQERDKIAMAGQRRTLTEHTYYNRMQELLSIIERYK